MSRWSREQFPSNNMFPLPPPLLPGVIAGAEEMNGQPFVGSFSGPQMMPNMNTEIKEVNMETSDDINVSGSRLNRGPSRVGVRGANERRRSRDRDRSRHEVDRPRSDRRDRPRSSKWSNADDTEVQGDHIGNQVRPMTAIMMAPNMPGHLGGQMIMPGPANMMQYPGMYANNMMGQQQLDMQNMNVQSSMMGMPGMMPNMMMDPAMMNQFYSQQMNPMMGGVMPMGNQVIYLNSAVLLPPIPGATMPERQEKPPGCCTIFVGGLPDSAKEDLIREIFQRFGKITDVKLKRNGICRIRYEMMESVDAAIILTGYRFRYQDQIDTEAITLFIDYAEHHDDQTEYERSKKGREPTPPRIEHFNPSNLTAISEKIKSEELFAEAAPTLISWLERGECQKKNANNFYSLLQATNNQYRRLINEKMQVEEEFSTLKTKMRVKFENILHQFELVAKILTASKQRRVWDHFTKVQRRNIDTWMKLTQDNLQEEFNVYFDDDVKPSKKTSWEEKYGELKRKNENLNYELAGYKNEARVAKEEAERKFERFKAQFIAQQALQNNTPYQPPLPHQVEQKPAAPPPLSDDVKIPLSGPTVVPTEARLISVITAFLLVHPLGASLDYVVSYVRSIMPKVTQATVHDILQKQDDVFALKTTGVGASIENRWTFITFDNLKIKSE